MMDWFNPKHVAMCVTEDLLFTFIEFIKQQDVFC